MPRTENFDQWFARWKKLTESLLGDIDEITRDEARQILANSEIDGQRVTERIHSKLSGYADSLRLQRRPVPEQILEALEGLRPDTAPPRNIKELEQEAERWIDRLSRPVSETLAPPQLAFSYRKKKALSPEDKEVLDKLAKKLEEKIKGK